LPNPPFPKLCQNASPFQSYEEAIFSLQYLQAVDGVLTVAEIFSRIFVPALCTYSRYFQSGCSFFAWDFGTAISFFSLSPSGNPQCTGTYVFHFLFFFVGFFSLRAERPDRLFFYFLPRPAGSDLGKTPLSPLFVRFAVRGYFSMTSSREIACVSGKTSYRSPPPHDTL